MTDDDYRSKLTRNGVHPDILSGLDAQGLNSVGNIIQVYRDGESAQTQDLAHYQIMQHKKARDER